MVEHLRSSQGVVFSDQCRAQDRPAPENGAARLANVTQDPIEPRTRRRTSGRSVGCDGSSNRGNVKHADVEAGVLGRRQLAALRVYGTLPRLSDVGGQHHLVPDIHQEGQIDVEDDVGFGPFHQHPLI